jgi:hypothetical protein
MYPSQPPGVLKLRKRAGASVRRVDRARRDAHVVQLVVHVRRRPREAGVDGRLREEELAVRVVAGRLDDDAVGAHPQVLAIVRPVKHH